MSPFSPTDTTSNDNPRIRAVEAYDSRRAETVSGREQRFRKWHVFRTDGSGEPVPSADSAVNETGVSFGDPHPEAALLRAYDVRTRISTTAGRGVYEVEWVYRNVLGLFDGQPEDPEAVDYQEFNITADPTLIDVYRAPPFPEFPLGGNNPQPGIDIGGVPLDTAGQKSSYLNRRAIIEVVRNYDIATYNPLLYVSAGGRRNAEAWEGFEAGRLLYLGSRTSRIAQGIVRVVHLLGFDEFFHLIQVANTDENGDVTLTEPGAVIGGVAYDSSHARPVGFAQPYPNLVNFDTLDMIAPGGGP